MEQNPQEKGTELEACEAERDQYLEGWKRAKADYLNLEKSIESRVESGKGVLETKILKEFLELADTFDQAFATEAPDSPWVEGIRQTHEKLQTILAKQGVVVIGTEGQKFDPNYHEAVEVVATDSEADDENIIEEVQKGYALRDKVLRPSRVKVAKYQAN